MKNRVAEERKQLGYSQEELAEKVGICRSYLSEIETGRRKNIGGQLMFDIAEALGKPVNKIFFKEVI